MILSLSPSVIIVPRCIQKKQQLKGLSLIYGRAPFYVSYYKLIIYSYSGYLSVSVFTIA